MSNVFDYHLSMFEIILMNKILKKQITHYSSKKGSLPFEKFIFTILTICNMMLIFYFSSQNAEQSTQTSAWFLQFLPFSMHFIRKLAHFTIYALLGYNTLYMYKNYNIKRFALIALLTCILYACSDEWHQSFISGRSPQITDICIDTIGALSMILLNLSIIRRKR